MGVKSKQSREGGTQGDLFTSLFPVRHRAAPRPLDLSLRVKTALGQALKETPDSATVVAARMSEIAGVEITADALYAYTAPSKPDHQISLLRFVAFVRATGALWLWDTLVEDEGLIVMEGREAHLAHLGALEQERQRLEGQIDDLKRDLAAQPVEVSNRKRVRR